MLGAQISEKNGNLGWILRPNHIVQWWFKVLLVGVFLGILIVWGIDGVNNVNNVANLQKDFAVLELNGSSAEFTDFSFTNVSLLPNIPQLNLSQTFGDFNLSKTQEEFAPEIAQNEVNLTQNQSMSQSQEKLAPEIASNEVHLAENLSWSETQEKLAPEIAQNGVNLTENQILGLNNTAEVTVNLNLNLNLKDEGLVERLERIRPSWIYAELEANYSSKLFDRWMAPGGEPCRESKTVDVTIPGLDGSSEGIELSSGEMHEFVLEALDDSGKPRCLGGDYFEIDLSGEKWKSRPPIKDFGNGTYKISLQVHPDFAGDYNLTVILLFRHYEGLKFSPQRFAVDQVLRVIPIRFKNSSAELPEISQCRKSDLGRDVWSGRWTRHAKNDSCPISNDGRYRCQEPNFPCQKPWCDGPLGSIESNGWVYSTHCSFKMYSSEEAWNCLSNRWIFWWGDSNHVDTIRNILNFILGLSNVKAVPRRYDTNITNPKNPSQTVRFTSIFNGHHNATSNYLGLNSLSNSEYRELLRGYFSGNVVPDTVIMNSGLHDGVYWPNLRSFIQGADYASAFWREIVEGVKRRGLAPPEIIYRTTITTGGYARRLAFNPHKMEAFNGVVLDKLKAYGILNQVIDDFDMTYPWHYDNRCNDGVHYGRAPLKYRWRDGQIGHQYFVDLMLCHVLLNSLCTR